MVIFWRENLQLAVDTVLEVVVLEHGWQLSWVVSKNCLYAWQKLGVDVLVVILYAICTREHSATKLTKIRLVIRGPTSCDLIFII